MKPSRELDSLVAEKVMGWKPGTSVGADGDGYWDAGFYKPNGTFTTHIPPYSTDIAAAWEVVEKLTNIRPDSGFNPEFELKCEEGHVDAMIWHASLEDRYTTTDWPDRFTIAFADTAPHAICLAALRAVGVKID